MKACYGRDEIAKINNLGNGYFVADMHFHTRYSHDCNTRVGNAINKAKELGIKFAITDHNRIGGVLEAYKSASGRRIVIPGIEVTVKEGKDILVYFYDINELIKFYEWLSRYIKRKSSLRTNKTQVSAKDLLTHLSTLNCVISLPHPIGATTKSSYGFFRKRPELLRYFNAIEVINETLAHKSNLTALGWAVSIGKPFTAGSDGHVLDRLGEAVTIAKASSRKEFLDSIKKGKVRVVGHEMRRIERLESVFSLFREKARLRINRKIDESSLSSGKAPR